MEAISDEDFFVHLRSKRERRTRRICIAFLAIIAIAFVGSLVGCSTANPPQPSPVYDPPAPVFDPPAPTPDPVEPIPAGDVAAWAAFAPLEAAFRAGQAVSKAQLDAALGAPRGSRSSASTGHRIHTYFVLSEGGDVQLNVHAHFVGADEARAVELNLR